MESLQMLVQFALEEDINTGDITTLATVSETARGAAKVIAKQQIVLAGSEAGLMVYKILSNRYGKVDVAFRYGDGRAIKKGEQIAEVTGSLRTILIGERTFLNFLARLSGIATFTRDCVNELQGTQTALLDTRKTIPAFRRLEKMAVFAGGGKNHRIGLFDQFLIKENHIAAAGGIIKAIELAREFKKERGLPRGIKIEIEVTNLKQLEEALACAPDIIMLDNFSVEDVIKAVRLRDRKQKKIKLEVSGGLQKGKIKQIAALGVDHISMGALTHSAPFADISMLVSNVDK